MLLKPCESFGRSLDTPEPVFLNFTNKRITVAHLGAFFHPKLSQGFSKTLSACPCGAFPLLLCVVSLCIPLHNVERQKLLYDEKFTNGRCYKIRKTLKQCS